MKSKTDEEILKIKHKLEAKGYTWDKYPTDGEWIARYRYLHAGPKIILKRCLHEIKQWIIVHPRTTLTYGLIIFLFAIMLYPAILAMQVGGQLISGEIVESPLTIAQLTGFMMLLASIVFFILAFGLLFFFSHGTSSVVADDEQAHKRKLRREELEKQKLTLSDCCGKTGEKEKQQ